MNNISINSIRTILLNSYIFEIYRNFFSLFIGYDKNDRVNSNNYSECLVKIGAIKKGSIFFTEKPDPLDVMNSIEEFIEIIEKDQECLSYVNNLIKIVKTTIKPNQKSVIEERTILLILKHFWKLKEEQEKKEFELHEYMYDKKEKKQKSFKDYSSLDQFENNVKSGNIEYDDYIKLIDNFLKDGRKIEEGEISYPKNIVNYLYIAKNIRNISAHTYRQFSNGELLCLCYFKLFSLMATVLYMRKALRVDYKKPVYLTIINSSEHSTIHVKLLDNENGQVLFDGSIKPKNEEDCEILRYHKHTIKISENNINEEFMPDYHLTPTETYNGEDLQFSHQKEDAIAENLNLLSQYLEKLVEQKDKSNYKLDDINKQIQISNSNQQITIDQLQTIVASLQTIINATGKKDNERQKQTQIAPRTKFWLKHIPIFAVLTLAGIACFLHCKYTYTIYWMLWKKWYLLALILGPLVLYIYLCYIYKSTAHKAILTTKAKQIGKVSIVLATLFWGIAILATPRPSAERYISISSWVQDSPNVLNKILQFHQQYLSKHPDSEIARIKLAKYYLDYVDDLDKALEITAPMKDVQKYRLGCSVAAKALYLAGEKDSKKYLEVDDILKKSRNISDSTSRLLIEIEALMKIQGFVTTAEPNIGILNLLALSKRWNDAELYYNLGYWMSHDINSGFNPESFYSQREIDFKWRYYDLAKSAYYLRISANKQFPKAAVELGNLYSDINLTDSANYYYDMAISQARGNLRNEALFKKSLLLEQKGNVDNKYLDEAINNGYSPAILHKAIKQKDHITAIAYYKKAGQYKGYRYIPPIVFEYLQAKEQKGYEGLRDSALVLLQREHPDCNFNEEFIEMMEYVIGTPRVNKNMEKAKRLSIISEKKGCLYAKMMNIYTDAKEKMNADKVLPVSYLDSLFEIAKVIPFAQVLACELEKSTGYRFFGMLDALRPIALNHPAAALMLEQTDIISDFFSENYNLTFKSPLIVKNPDYYKDLSYFYLIQKGIRFPSPYKNNLVIWGYCLYKSFKNNHKEIDNYHADTTATNGFWTDALFASDCFGMKIHEALSLKFSGADTTTINKLVLSALAQLNDESSQSAWKLWLSCGYSLLTHAEMEKLLKNKEFNQKVEDYFSHMEKGTRISTTKGEYGKWLFYSPTISLTPSTITLLDEYSSFMDLLKENDHVFRTIPSDSLFNNK